MQPYASNDTYICPDCGSEVRVGARRCPGCGPFRPVNQEEEENDAELMALIDPKRRNSLVPLPLSAYDEESGKPRMSRFTAWFLVILIALTILSAVTTLLRFLVQ